MRKVLPVFTAIGAIVLWFCRGAVENWFFNEVLKMIEPDWSALNWRWLVEYGPPAAMAAITFVLLRHEIVAGVKRVLNLKNPDIWVYDAAHYIVTRDWSAPKIVGYGLEIERLRNEGTTRWRSEVNAVTGKQEHIKLTPEEEAVLIRNGRIHYVNEALGEMRKAASSDLPIWSHDDSDSSPKRINKEYWKSYRFAEVTDLKQATPEGLMTKNEIPPNSKPIYHSLKTNKAEIEKRWPSKPL